MFNASDNADNGGFAFISNGELIINDHGTLQVIDVLGRELVRKELSPLNSNLSTLTFKPGVYILKLNDKVQKIVIK